MGLLSWPVRAQRRGQGGTACAAEPRTFVSNRPRFFLGLFQRVDPTVRHAATHHTRRHVAAACPREQIIQQLAQEMHAFPGRGRVLRPPLSFFLKQNPRGMPQLSPQSFDVQCFGRPLPRPFFFFFSLFFSDEPRRIIASDNHTIPFLPLPLPRHVTLFRSSPSSLVHAIRIPRVRPYSRDRVLISLASLICLAYPSHLPVSSFPPSLWCRLFRRRAHRLSFLLFHQFCQVTRVSLLLFTAGKQNKRHPSFLRAGPASLRSALCSIPLLPLTTCSLGGRAGAGTGRYSLLSLVSI